MGEIEIVTKSRLAVFNKCQRLHHLRYDLGYQSTALREHADFGTVFHAGLDAWWKAHADGMPMMAYAAALTAMMAARAAAPGVDDFAMAKAEVLMQAYDLRWGPSMEEWEVLGIEVEFIAVIKGRKLLRVAGKLDKLLRRRADRTIWFGEHKTSGVDLSEGSTYWQRLRMDPQVSIYYRGVRELGHEPVGCLYDVVVRPDQRQLKATPQDQRQYTIAKPATKTKPAEPSRLYSKQREFDESVAEYRERVGGTIAVRPDAYFARSEVTRLETEIVDSERDVEEVALQIRRGPIGGVTPRNPDACFLYNRPCDFLDACSGIVSLDDESRFVRVEPHQELTIHKDLA